MEPFEFSFTLKQKEVRQFMRIQFMRQQQIKFIVMSNALFAGFFLLFGLCSEFTQGGLITFTLCASIFLVLPFLFLILVPALSAWTAYKQGGKAINITWRMTGDHLEVQDALTKKEVPWSLFSKPEEVKGLYLLHGEKSNHIVQFVPKRVFESHEQEQMFRQYLETFIRSNKD